MSERGQRAPVERAPQHLDDGASGTQVRRIVRSSAVVGLGTALSRVTGFLRVSAMAAIGFGALTDVYNIANSTPNIVYELVLGGILTATLVPLFVEQLEHRDERAVNAIASVALVGLVVVTVLGVLAAPWIIRLYTLRLHGHDRAQQQALATALLRLFMPQIFFYGFTALATALLNARRRFAAAAFAPALNNVIVIAVFLLLPRITSRPLTVATVRHDTGLVLFLGLGTTLGIVVMALALVPALRGAGVHLRFVWSWRHESVRKLARLSGWTVGYVAANQIAFWIALFLAYGRKGDASVYLAAFIFFQLPHGLFSVSIMTAIVPELSARATAGDLGGFRRQYALGMRLMGLVVLPASGLMVVLAGPVVNALLKYGAFSTRSASLTAQTLAAFGVGLFFFSVYLYTLRGFYSMQDTRTPFWLNCFENGVNIVFALALYPWLGVQGLALSWSIAYVAAAVVALGALRKRLHRLEGARTTRTLARVTVATVCASLVAWGAATAIGYRGPARAIPATAVALLAAGLVYVWALRRMRVSELRILASALHRREAPSPTLGVEA